MTLAADRTLPFFGVASMGGILAPDVSVAGVPSGGDMMLSLDSAQAVPTLGGIMLLILGLLFAFIALVTLKNRTPGQAGSPVVLALAAGTISAAIGGSTLITDARAQAPFNLVIDLADFGDNDQYTAPIPRSESVYTNDTGQNVAIDNISLDSGVERETITSGEPECNEGTTLPPDGSCGIRIRGALVAE